MSSTSGTRDFREIYGLYKELHATMTTSSSRGNAPGRGKLFCCGVCLEIWQRVHIRLRTGTDDAWKQLFARLGTPLSNQPLPHDMATLHARCCAHLSRHKRPADLAEFRRLHESLAASMSRPQHCAVLTLLLQLAEDEARQRANAANGGDPAAPQTINNPTGIVGSGVGGLRGAFERSCSVGYGSSSSLHMTPNQSSAGASGAVDSRLLGLTRCATSPSVSSSGGSNGVAYRHQQQQQQLSTTAAVNNKHIIVPTNNTVDPLVQDVIYALGGVSGQYLRKDIISGGYKLDAKTAGTLSACHAGAMLRVAELGYYHNWLVEFLKPSGGRTPLGLMGQGLCTMMHTDLTNYYGFVAMLQEEFNRNRAGGGDDSAEQRPLTLLKLQMLCSQPLHRFSWLATVAETCQTQKGGELASAVAAYRPNGDPVVQQLIDEMLTAVCGPLQQMLAGWLLEGEINDPHGEFFIETLPDVGADRLWSDKYRVRRAQLPSFVAAELANMVLVTGKSVNFLREVCRDQTPVRGREELLQCLADSGEHLFAVVADTRLHVLIERVYLSTSKKVLDIVMGPHKLLQHLKAMRNYLLLGQGDFVGNLIENLK